METIQETHVDQPARHAVQLGHGRLSVLDVVAQSLGFIGPVFSAAFLLPSVAGLGATGKGAGIASPLVLIIATIGMSGVAWIISRYARRIHAAGALYDYVTDGFGQRAGFMAGWIYYGGMTALTLSVYTALGGFMAITLLGNHGIDVPWYLLAIGAVVVCFGMTILGVQISTRAQLTIALLSVAVILGWAIYVIAKGGPTGNSIEPFSFSSTSLSSVVYGLLYATLVFTGFETAANLAEETSNPRRSIPRAVMTSVVVVGVFYVIVMYGMELAFGFDMAAFLDLANFPPLYVGASNPDFGGATFGEIVQWIVVLDIAAVALGCANANVRGYYAMARDGRLPKVFATLHPRFKTPYIAAIVLAAGAILLMLVIQLTDGLAPAGPADPGVWFPMFQFGATIGALGLILVYLMIAISGFRGQPGEARVGLAVAAVLGTATTLAAVVGTVYKAPPVYWLNNVWWLMALWAIAGLIVMVMLARSGGFSRATTTQARQAEQG